MEETLRWQPALASVPLRYATTDIALADGTPLAGGDAILASHAAANRDPAHHGADAHRFDASRGARGHLAFGPVRISSSGRRSPGWMRTSRCPRCSPASPRCAWWSRRGSWSRPSRSSPTVTGDPGQVA